MFEDIMVQNEGVTTNRREKEILKENFPSCFHDDDSFDIERFKRFLSDKVYVY